MIWNGGSISIYYKNNISKNPKRLIIWNEWSITGQ
jgi:hypothetical protein